MRYRQLGKTGLRISEIGFGTGNTAGLMLRASPEERVRAVERALELGVNYFDTSPDYGKEAAERNLGQALREVGARPVITTKVEILPGHLDDIAGAVVQSIDASLKRLGSGLRGHRRDSQQPGFQAYPGLSHGDGWRCRWRTTWAARERWRGWRMLGVLERWGSLGLERQWSRRIGPGSTG